MSQSEILRSITNIDKDKATTCVYCGVNISVDWRRCIICGVKNSYREVFNKSDPHTVVVYSPTIAPGLTLGQISEVD